MNTKTFSAIVLAFSLSACGTEMGETTQMGAATGGVLGAGLGAIVGSQTGNAGSGLVIGAAAGAGTGAAVGNLIEGQQEAMRTQDEAIERQERTLHAQEAELNELRRMNRDDNAAWQRSQPAQGIARFNNRVAAQGKLSEPARLAPAGRLAERDILPEDRPALAPPEERGPSGQLEQEMRGSLVRPDSEACRNAQSELQQSDQAREDADKLFHLRRALRLCPDSAEFHNALGQVYARMGRKADAEFEYKEALRLDPNSELARENLNSLGNTR